ncbi:MAG TPA: hypothetical protein VIL95_01740 [Bacillota bacterium]
MRPRVRLLLTLVAIGLLVAVAFWITGYLTRKDMERFRRSDLGPAGAVGLHFLAEEASTNSWGVSSHA